MSLPASAAVVAIVVLGCVPFARAEHREASSRTTATVERIVDGDTLVVRGGQRVRLLQIDSPEAGGECYSAAATRERRDSLVRGCGSCSGSPRLDRVDRYGRLLRYVHAGRMNVNVELSGGARDPYSRRRPGRYAAGCSPRSRPRAARPWDVSACRVFQIEAPSRLPRSERRSRPSSEDVLRAKQTLPVPSVLKRGPRRAHGGNPARQRHRERGQVTAAQFETIDETEAEMILRWRFDELARSGYDVDSALLLASHVEVDLHEASTLLRRGCPTETALRILL
jgi:endonuclease YncB( thermonuclease family)